MDVNQALAERFEEHRIRLRAVAYRMLGSLSERKPRRRRGHAAGQLPGATRRPAVAFDELAMAV